MSDFILKALFNKISKEFEFEYPPFLSRSEFEKQLPGAIFQLKNQLVDLKSEYFNKLNSNNIEEFKSLIKVRLEDFIINPSLYFKYSEVLTKDSKEFLYEEILKTKLNEDKLLSLILNPIQKTYFLKEKLEVTNKWIISPLEYFNNNKEIILSSSINISFSKYILTTLLYKNSYFHFSNDSFKYFLEKDEIKKEIIESFINSYYEKQGVFMDLLEMSIKYIQKEEFLPFSRWLFNVGHRNFSRTYNNKISSNFIVLNEGKSYKFSHINDGKEINDVFVNFFNLSNNELIKVCIGSKGLLQRTPYLLSKDIQRVDIINGNTIEIHMHKHFDPETIIFDTEEIAYKFQKIITELREQRRNPINRK